MSLLFALLNPAQAGDLTLTVEAEEVGPVTLEMVDIASCYPSSMAFRTEAGERWEVKASASTPSSGETLVKLEVGYHNGRTEMQSNPTLLLQKGESGTIDISTSDGTGYALTVSAKGFTPCSDAFERRSRQRRGNAL